jgi:hypothetical protein
VLFSGTGKLEWAVITADTATTLTFAGGLQTNIYQLPIVTPDGTSQFVIEPYWKGNPTTSGSVVFAPFNFNVIDGTTGTAASDAELYDVAAPGGQINISGPNSKVKHVSVSRADWLGNNGAQGFVVENNLNQWDVDDVYVDRYDLTGWGMIPWTFYRNSGGNDFYSGVSFQNRGTRPICWSYGQTGGGLSANDVCVGIRTDNNSTNSASRAVLGYKGTLGPETAWGVDQNGKINRLQGGLPTGAGVPGDIAFSTGNAGASGSSVADGTDRWKILGPTGHLVAGADNTYDFGASGSNRPRDLWLGRNADIAGNLTVHGTCTGRGGSGSSPLTSKGDIYIFGNVSGTNTNTRLPATGVVRTYLSDFLAPVFQCLLHQCHELVGDGAVDQAMIVPQREVHD